MAGHIDLHLSLRQNQAGRKVLLVETVVVHLMGRLVEMAADRLEGQDSGKMILPLFDMDFGHS